MRQPALEHSVVTHLQQVHAAELAQVGELRALRDTCTLAAARVLLDGHEVETRYHALRIEERLDELREGGSIRLLTRALAGSIPKLVVDHLRPHSQCAILRDAVVAEAGEVMGYLLLEFEALRAGDDATALLARELCEQERDTRGELDTFWNQAVGADVDQRAGSGSGSGSGTSRTRIVDAMLVDHLRDIHALERSAVMMLGTVLGTVDDELVRGRVDDHRSATVRHGDEVALRLRELESGPSKRKQARGVAFATVKGPINFVRRERAAKDLRDMYVAEHMQAVAYEQLAVLADLAGDDRTARLAHDHLAEERAMTLWLEREGARFLLETLEKTAG